LEAPPQEGEWLPLRDNRERYRYEGLVSDEGGFGVVHKALDTATDRHVAVKVMRRVQNRARRAQLARDFQTELQLMLLLHHENIVQVFAGDEWQFSADDVRPAIIMEFMGDGTLAGRLSSLREMGKLLPVPTALRWMREVLVALSYAHGCGVRHRDIKPANVFVSGDSLKLGDFGLGKLVEQTTRMMSYKHGGSMGYMAPEVARGDCAIDNRADLYSMGIVFHEMLTCEHPFGEAGAQDLHNQYGTREAQVRPGGPRPALLPEIDAFVRKMAAYDPHGRFPTAARALSALPVVEKGPITIRGTMALRAPEVQAGRAVGDPPDATDGTLTEAFEGFLRAWTAGGGGAPGLIVGYGGTVNTSVPGGAASCSCLGMWQARGEALFRVEARLCAEDDAWEALVARPVSRTADKVAWREIRYRLPMRLPMSQWARICDRRPLKLLRGGAVSSRIRVPSGEDETGWATLQVQNRVDGLHVAWTNGPFKSVGWLTGQASPGVTAACLDSWFSE
jgi:hypothetical protein